MSPNFFSGPPGLRKWHFLKKPDVFDLMTHIPWTTDMSWVEKYWSHPLTNSLNIILVRRTCVEKGSAVKAVHTFDVILHSFFKIGFLGRSLMMLRFRSPIFPFFSQFTKCWKLSWPEQPNAWQLTWPLTLPRIRFPESIVSWTWDPRIWFSERFSSFSDKSPCPFSASGPSFYSSALLLQRFFFSKVTHVVSNKVNL